MINRGFLVAILLLSALFSYQVSVSADTGAGIIQGQVLNGTPGGDSAAGLNVTLQTYVDGEAQGTASAVTDPDGKFGFSALSANASYKVKLQYKGVDYVGELISFAEGETTKSTAVNIYETTDAPDKIKAHLIQVVAYFVHGQLLVEEYDIFRNTGDRTYVGSKAVGDAGGKEVIAVSLPVEAMKDTLQFPPEDASKQGMMVMPGSAVKLTGDGFASTMPLVPGDTIVTFAYASDYTSPDYTLSKIISQPADLVQVVIYGSGIKSDSSDLIPVATSEDDFGTFTEFAAQNIQANTSVSVALSNLGSPGVDPLQNAPSQTSQSNPDSSKWIVIALVAGLLAVSAALAYMFLIRRRTPVAVPMGDLAAQSDDLIQQIADLDDDYEAGTISEEQYHQMREEKKAQLAAIMNPTGQD